MQRLKIILVVLAVTLKVTAQIEMHGADRANESLQENSKKARHKELLKAFEQESKVSKALKDSSGDRAEVAKLCPVPAGWRPKKSEVAKSKQWDIVPSGHISKTYPRKTGITESDAKSEFESIGDPKIEDCDYVTVKFKGDHVETVDFSKCEDPEITTDNYKPCNDLLKYLSEKSKTK